MKYLRVSRAIALGLVVGSAATGLARAQCNESVLAPIPGSQVYYFGKESAISGATIAIGVGGDWTQFNSGGSVHIFDRQGAGWVRTAVLFPSQPAAQLKFGRSVAICEDTLFVGTRANVGEGSVQIFERQAGNWLFVQELVAPPGPPGPAEFDRTAYLTSDEAVILATGQERIYFFEKQGASWVETSWLDHTVLLPYPFNTGQNIFAREIAIDHDRIVLRNLNGPIYVIERDSSGVWGPIAELFVPGVNPFSPGIDIQGGTVMMGVWDFGIGGGVFVFEEGPTGWTLAQTLLPADLTQGQGFGVDVSMFGDRVLVSSHRDSTQIEDGGAVYVFERTAGIWIEIAKIQPSVPVFDAFFGIPALLWGDQAIIGGAEGVSGPSPRGQLYVFDLGNHQGAPYCATNANSSGQPASLTAYGSRRAILSCLSLDVTSLPANQFGYFVMAREQGFLSLIGNGDGNLCLGLPFVRLAGHVQNSGTGGSASFEPDLAALPGGVTIAPGETWNFQYWTRDGASSNLSNGLAITFTTGDESVVQFPVTEASVEEETTTLEVTITLSEPTHDDALVPFTTGGTATYDVDWRVEELNPIVIPAGEISCEMTILVAEDSGQEGDETAIVNLGAPTGGVLGTAPVFTLTIVDDD